MAKICTCGEQEVKSRYYFDVSIEDPEYPKTQNQTHFYFFEESEIVEGCQQTRIMSIPEEGCNEAKTLAVFNNDTLKALIKKL